MEEIKTENLSNFIHDIIDEAEREISQELKLHLVIHMDPICIETEEVNIAHMAVDSSIKPSLKLPKDIMLEDMHPGYIEIPLREEFFE